MNATITRTGTSAKAAKLRLASANAAAALALSKTNIQYARDVLAEYERSGSVEFDMFRARLGMAAMSPSVELMMFVMNLPASAPWQIVELAAATQPNCGGCQQRRCPKGCPNN